MKYDALNDLMSRLEAALADEKMIREKLHALGVTDLPGDAPTVAPKPAPGNLPGEPTEEMVRAALDAWDTCDEPTGTKIMTRTLRAALAAAPRVEVPEVTDEDVDAYRAHEGTIYEALNMVRARLIARMGAKS